MTTVNKPAQSKEKKVKQKSKLQTFKKSLPLTIMALPAVITMILFRYLPLIGLVLAFKDFNVRKGIFGSEFIMFENFEFLFRTNSLLQITLNTLGYNILFIVLDVLIATTMAIALNELLNKRRAKIFQTIFMAPYFLSWVVISFIAYSFLSVDDGFINNMLQNLGMETVQWYSAAEHWPFIITFSHIWKVTGYSTVMYLGALTSISNDYYEAAIIDGATKWQQITKITLPFLKPMIIILTIIAVGKIFYSDFGLFYQLPRNSGPLFDATNVIDTYIYRGLKDTGDIGMSAAANLYQSFVGFILVLTANLIVRKIEPDSAMF